MGLLGKMLKLHIQRSHPDPKERFSAGLFGNMK